MPDAPKSAEKPKSTAKSGGNPVGDAAVLDEDVQKALLENVPAHQSTASGVAARELGEDAPERIKGEDRGSTQPVAGDPQPDFIGEPAKASGLQAAPAIVVANGSIRATMVGSPSGPVPVSTVAGDPEAAAKRLKERNESIEEQVKTRELRNLTDEELSKLSAAEIRAVATDRGYDIPMRGGRRAAARDFSGAQAEDSRVAEAKKPATPAKK